MTWTPILWLLAFLPALVALYFLKLRRKDVMVSSTLLWTRTVEDLRVNAPFQRLRTSWLLLLQLLILLALIAAAWRPRAAAPQVAGHNLILLLDNSASMSAREAGGSRLDLAKQSALELVASLAEGDRAALLVFSSKTVVAEPLTGAKAKLEARIRAVHGTVLPTNLEQALGVAHAMASALTDAEVRVFGDGCYGDLSTLSPEEKRMNVKLVSTATPLDNLGIVELDVRRTFESKERSEVFALVQNDSDAARTVVVTLKLDGRTRDARELNVAAHGTSPITFELDLDATGVLEASINAQDALALDDVAWAILAPRRPARVALVGKPNTWLDLVLKATPSVAARRLPEEEYRRIVESAGRADAAGALEADVLLFDRAETSTLRAGSAREAEAGLAEPLLPSIYVACEPPAAASDSLWKPEAVARPAILDWDRAHPVNRFIVYSDLYVEESRVLKDRPEIRCLVDSDKGCVLGALRYYPAGRKPTPAIVIGFDILKSNWPLGHFSFPIFFANAVEWLGTSSSSSSSTRLRAGEPMLFEHAGSGTDVGEVSFRSPSGVVMPALQESEGTYAFAGAEEAGVYETLVKGQVEAQTAVSILNEQESRLRPTREVDFGDYKVDVASAPPGGLGGLWKPFVLAAIVACLLEWAIYHRRIAG
jgi:hypothetical protein